jgi:5-methylcytosine-specific restriction endonuclease McrA
MLFYPGDWIKDPALSKCTPSTRGIWIDLLCAMHDSGRIGMISGTATELSRICRCGRAEISRAVTELKMSDTADVSIRGRIITITNRRMYRESIDRVKAAERQAAFRERGGGDPERWTAIRAIILTRDGKTCAYCGRYATTVDHVIPRAKGGMHVPHNLVACCKKCNNRKLNRTPEEAGMRFRKAFDVTVLVASNLEVTHESPASNAYSSFSSSSSKQTRDISVERERDGKASEALSVSVEEIREIQDCGLYAFDVTAVVKKQTVYLGRPPTRQELLGWLNRERQEGSDDNGSSSQAARVAASLSRDN